MNKIEHYSSYPKGNVPIYLAYGFRPFFLVVAPYIVISIVLWSFVFAGYIKLPIENILNWHIYEMIFGVGSAMIMAFFLTALPELFKEEKPIVGKKLAYLVLFWVLGRFSFWFIDYFGVLFVGILNVSLLSYVSYLLSIPAFKDKNKKHISLVYSMLLIVFAQILFFLAEARLIILDSYKILLLSLGFFLVLIFLALRRVSTEAINHFLEDRNIDEIYMARSFRYNLAIFCIFLYSFVEFFFENNSALAYISFACAFSIFSILNDFVLKDNNILFKPFILYLISIIFISSIGFMFLAFDYLLELNYLNHFRHFLTTGTFGVVFYVIMIIVSTIHTGRKIFTNIFLSFGLILIFLATFLRSLIPYYMEYAVLAYILSSILWALSFIIYMKIFFPFLLSARYDGLKG